MALLHKACDTRGYHFSKRDPSHGFCGRDAKGGGAVHAALNTVLGESYLQLIPGQNDDALCGIGGHFSRESPRVTRSAKDCVYATLLRH